MFSASRAVYYVPVQSQSEPLIHHGYISVSKLTIQPFWRKRKTGYFSKTQKSWVPEISLTFHLDEEKIMFVAQNFYKLFFYIASFYLC